MALREVYKPKDLKETLDLLEQYKEKAKVIAGGTDIVIDLRHNRISPEVMIDISSLDEIIYMKENNENIEIGAATTFTEIGSNPLTDGGLKGLRDAANSVGSPQIRNGGTVGGNICNGSPAADTVPPLLALGAVAIIGSKNGNREVPLEEFFLDKGKVDLKDEELLLGVRFKKPLKGQGVSFSKLGLRKALAISRICTSVYLSLDENNKCDDIRVANGSLGRYAVREKEVEEFFKGKMINDELIEEGARLLQKEVEKRLAGRSTVEFKAEAVKGTFKEAMSKAISNCK